ncbi:MAG: putative Ig domain-containing protein [Acidobacteriota bacterium]
MSFMLESLLRVPLRAIAILFSVTVLLFGCAQLASATTPTITTASPLPSGQVATPYSVTLAATGGTTPYTWTISTGSLPAGLSINASTGTISGTPTAGGITSNFTVKVTGSGGGFGTKAMQILVNNMAITIPTAGTGNKIFINGARGTLFGWTFVGLANTTTCATPYYATPNSYWGTYSSEELDWVKQMYGNTVRFQVSLDELTEASPFDQTVVNNYIATIGNAIALARSKGMAVIVSMQWESGTNGSSICDNASPTNHYGHVLTGNPTTDNALNGWEALFSSSSWYANTSVGGITRNFFNDSGVLLEIFNEPLLGTVAGTSSDWTAWNGPMQTLVSGIRSFTLTVGSNTYSAKNVLVVDGLREARLLDATTLGGLAITYNSNMYMMTDSLANANDTYVIYAVHPYPFVSVAGTVNMGYFNKADYDDYFGFVSQNMPAPVMVTEWITSGGDVPMCWDTHTPKQPSPTPPNYTTMRTSLDIKDDFISWMTTGGPGNVIPMSMTATAFEEAGFWLQDPANELPANTLHSTNFTGWTDSTFPCNTQVTGTDGNLTYPGPGAGLSNYYQTNHVP